MTRTHENRWRLVGLLICAGLAGAYFRLCRGCRLESTHLCALWDPCGKRSMVGCVFPFGTHEIRKNAKFGNEVWFAVQTCRIVGLCGLCVFARPSVGSLQGKTMGATNTLPMAT